MALSVALQAQQYVFRAYRQSEGLKNLAINGLAQDREGFLWVATENGVYRFSGSGFQKFGREQGIAELDVQNIVADPTGTVWAGTSENLYRWDGVRFVPAGRDPIHLLGYHRLAVEDANHLLVVEGRRLFRLEHDGSGKLVSYAPVFTDQRVRTDQDLGQVASVSVVNPSSSGSRVWMGCGSKLCSWLDGELGSVNQGPSRPRDGAVTVWGEDQGLLPDEWQSVLLDRTGTIWAASQKHVAVLPLGTKRFAAREIPGSDPENIYGHAPLVADRQGRILAPAEDGVARWSGSAWQIVSRANGLLHNSHISDMTFDATGDLWLGSRGDGLYNWTGYEDWEGWGIAQGLPSASVWSIVVDRPDRVFVGTDKGPAVVDPTRGSGSRLFQADRWAYGQIGAMGVNRDGSLWANTFSGAVLHINPKTGRTEQTAKLSDHISYALQDAAGRVLFATNNQGVYLRDAEAPRGVPQRISALDGMLGNSTRVQAGCLAPNGAIWLLSNNRLFRGLGGQWTRPQIDGLSNLNGELLSLSCARDGALWVAGDQDGIWRLTEGGGRMQAWQLQLPPELRHLAPLAILVDRRDWVWVGTDSGLAVWNGRNWRHLTQESGLIWNDVNQSALREAPDGTVWIGTSGGLAHILHPEHVFEPVPMAVAITEISHLHDIFTGARQVVLPWPGTPLHFQVACPATRNRSETIIKIWMVGLHRDWLDTFNGIATFTNLAPGNYTFMAMASNAGLSAYSEPVKVQVKILPPWWKTWWFYGLCLLALALLIFATSQLFARHLRLRAKDLERLVSQRTQELEASREQLRIQATHDGLTGLLNRVAVLSALEAEMDRAKRERRTLVVALADLDNFKRVNDTHGHLAGDEALRIFASSVLAAVRAYDHAGRYGGEEFLLIVNEIPKEATESRLESLHASITNLHVSAQGREFKITCSMGATVYDPSDGPRSVESLLAFADVALYEAKAAGRNRVVFRKSVELYSGDEAPST
jgi:diguanylate cyclase (GGDEF)-like protein